MKKIELLAPAGNLEKLKYAIAYGADAVYAGVPDFSLRVRINNFTRESLREAAEFARKHKKKIYITLNIYAHNDHLERVKEHLKFLKTLDIDGVIVADPGIIRLVKKHLPKTEIHLSTQANATNIEAVKFWAEIGIKRIVLAREVTLE
ncbi:MAG: peptidase U32 family protein, partial [bacterium]|nr:peptidase U32 family protein [bacterium]